jgi:mannose-6-phosphate isomerase-like protein (cupin superfamily)
MKSYIGDIHNILENNNYRKVLYTIPKGIQLVTMSLKPREEIGMEVHPDTTQFFHIIKGRANIIIDGSTIKTKAGSIVVVPPGAEHNVVNVSKTRKLKLLTIYNPPEHPRGKIQKKK